MGGSLTPSCTIRINNYLFISLWRVALHARVTAKRIRRLIRSRYISDGSRGALVLSDLSMSMSIWWFSILIIIFYYNFFNEYAIRYFVTLVQFPPFSFCEFLWTYSLTSIQVFLYLDEASFNYRMRLRFNIVFFVNGFSIISYWFSNSLVKGQITWIATVKYYME